VGASNELPESEDLDALYDRFLIRKKVEQVSSSGLRELLADTSDPSASFGENGGANGKSVDISDETFNSIRCQDDQTLVLQGDATHILTFVVRVPGAEMVGLGFNPWAGHLGTWDFSQGRSQRNCTLAKSNNYPGTPLPISQWWLECVDDELSAFAVKTLSL